MYVTLKVGLMHLITWLNFLAHINIGNISQRMGPKPIPYSLSTYASGYGNLITGLGIHD